MLQLRKLWFFGFVILVVSVIILCSGKARYEIRTDKEEYFVGETVHASFVMVNELPFPVPESAITHMDFGCSLNGKPTGSGYSAFMTPTGSVFFIKPGEETWLTPIEVTPEEPGELMIYVKIEGPEYEKTYTKTVVIKRLS